MSRRATRIIAVTSLVFGVAALLAPPAHAAQRSALNVLQSL